EKLLLGVWGQQAPANLSFAGRTGGRVPFGRRQYAQQKEAFGGTASLQTTLFRQPLNLPTSNPLARTASLPPQADLSQAGCPYCRRSPASSPGTWAACRRRR